MHLGIYETDKEGAYSIVLSGSSYNDRDDGESTTYSGTDGKDGNVTGTTKAMIKYIKTQNPVCVLRSAQLSKSNKYRPACGLQYVGLYLVEKYEISDTVKQIHLLSLIGYLASSRSDTRKPARITTALSVPVRSKLWDSKSSRRKTGLNPVAYCQNGSDFCEIAAVTSKLAMLLSGSTISGTALNSHTNLLHWYPEK